MNDLQGTEIAKVPRGQKVGQNLLLYAGRIMPSTFGEVIEFSQMMCKAGLAIPKHMRDNPGVCMSVIQRSMAWQMDPWAVATKTYAVNDILAYEAQLIAAVVKKWAPVTERIIAPVYDGEGVTRRCTITLHHEETGEELVYISPIIGKALGSEIKIPGPDYVGIFPKNSPLWRTEPDQQLFYYSIRAMARRFFPDIILGVYDREEVLAMKDITPKAQVDNLLDDEPAGGAPPTGPTPAEAGPDNPGPATPEVTIESRIEAAEAERRAADEEEEEEEDNPIVEIISVPPVSPEVIAANMMRSIKAAMDLKSVNTLAAQYKPDIVNLPGGLAARVRLVLQERIKTLESEEL